LCLFPVIGIFYASSLSNIGGDAAVITALGFLLLAGTILAELVEILGLPHLTGYLLAGIFAGPHVLRVIDPITVKRLAPVNTLALALIALAGGAELNAEHIRRGVRSLLIATGIHSVVGTITCGAVFFLLRPFIPFVRDMTALQLLAVALLWGVLAVSRSPSATLAILSQTRAKGEVARFALAFVMSSDVVVILLMALASMIARPLLEPSAPLSFDAFRTLGHEVIGSVSIGTTLGVALIIYMRVSGKQLPVVLVALGFGASEVLNYLRFDALLTFLVAGFIVQNLSQQGPKFLRGVEDMGAIVYVVFFASAGADLDVPLLVALWPVALALALSRGLVTFASARVSSRIARDPAVLKQWGWTSLIAQAGLTQGLAGLVEHEFPAFGTPLRGLVMAVLAINAIIGPILFKLGLDRASETQDALPALPTVPEAA
jgi:Kef-type K+ transport system membrane component KefB